jgi:chromosome segregation ATPase
MESIPMTDVSTPGKKRQKMARGEAFTIVEPGPNPLEAEVATLQKDKADLTAALAAAQQEVTTQQAMVANLKHARQVSEGISVDGQKKIEALTQANAGLTRTNEQFLAKNQDLEKRLGQEREHGRTASSQSEPGSRTSTSSCSWNRSNSCRRCVCKSPSMRKDNHELRSCLA